ncbi:MAG: hypothetical protein WC139_02120 [Candidatus Kapaibacterium sp.]
MEWFISNLNIELNSSTLNGISTNVNWVSFYDPNEYSAYIEGYIIPRKSHFNEYQNLTKHELIYKLFSRYKFNFIKYIKGSFNIIIKQGTSYYIFNDIHSLKKYFIYRDSNNFILSNSMKFISDNVKLSFSRENAIIFSLMKHFVQGNTLFYNLTFSNPATVLRIIENEITIDIYWDPINLVSLKKEIYDFKYLSIHWQEIINNYIQYLKPEKISLTLTGGNDTRLILNALLGLGYKPKAFSFGNPMSSDCIVAALIAKRAGLDYNNHFVSTPTANWFSEYSNKIIKLGNTLINIHRAHRLDAVEQESNCYPCSDILFGGFMGGDYIKGLVYNKYITSEFAENWILNKNNKHNILKNILSNEKIKIDHNEINNILLMLKKHPFFNTNEKHIINEFLFVFYVVGCIHDYQDTTIFNTKYKYVINPYMDIDFLELLFSSNYSMLSKNNPRDNFIKKMFYPEFQVNISHKLFPELSDLDYAKKGFYSNNDYLKNKNIYIIKRMGRYLNKSKYPQNFPYGNWIKEFIIQEFKNINNNLSLLYDINDLEHKLKTDQIDPIEGNIHIFTNVINLNKNLRYFNI